MTAAPPAGLLARRPEPGDVPAIHDLLRRYDTAVIGVSDTTVQDVADDLADPEFDLARDAWLVHRDGDGRLVGWGWACRNGSSDNVDVEVYLDPSAAAADRAGGWLWDAVLGRAAEIGVELGHEATVVDTGVYRTDTAKREQAGVRGFAPATTYHRMYVAHDAPGPTPAAPPGVTVRTAGADAGLRRAGHRVYQESFADHFGFYAEDYDGWAARLEASGSHDWDLLRVAEVDGSPAAMLLGSNQFVPDHDSGYVRALGVLPRYRGRGLAAHLLRRAFADDARAGRSGTFLHVDTNNRTPALELYLKVGMRAVLVVDVWRRTLSGPPP
jgi:ribosomal protein S18 acetylase RimI-like enzyme